MSRWRSETMGPICVASSIGSPITAVFVRSARRLRKASRMPVLHEDPRPVGTDLPGGIEIRVDRGRHRILQIGVVEDDQGRLAAQFHRRVFQARGRGGIDLAARGHRSGERDLGHARVADQRGAHLRRPWMTLKTPGGAPASTRISASFKALSGVSSDGLNTIALPQASAGAPSSRRSGWGSSTRRWPTQTPRGSRIV
jgi:hypothetical protein